jgi:hypothetical protein
MAHFPGEGGDPMRVRLLLPLVLVALVGCSQKPAVVPAPCPPPPAIPRPALRVDKLPPDAPLADVARAYALDLADVIGWAHQLEAALDAYRPPVVKPPQPGGSDGK